jgi:flagellar biosynthesis/type III secretory pathway chaperone
MNQRHSTDASRKLSLEIWANWLTFGVVIIAFVISFGALRDLADKVGITYPSLYPLMIDAGLVIYNIMALQSSLSGERNRYAWFLIVMATLTSVFLNVLHAVDDLPTWLGPTMAAVPPLVIFGAFHLVVLRIEQKARLERVSQRIGELETALGQKQTELNQLNNTIQTRTNELETLDVQLEQDTSDLEALRKEKQRLTRTLSVSNQNKPTAVATNNSNGQATSKTAAMDALLVYVAEHPTATLAAIGQHIGRSKSTVGSYVAELTTAGHLTRNDDGWQVITAGKQNEATNNDA